MLKGQRWWWYAVALGLLIASAASPTNAARQGVLTAAWLWPALVWSQMGARESRYSTQSLIFCSARTLQRQLPAVWVAGFIVALLTGGGYALRLLANADWPLLVAWFAGALFIPSFGAGAWSLERNLKTLRGDLHRVVVFGAIKSRSRIRLHRERFCHELAGLVHRVERRTGVGSVFRTPSANGIRLVDEPNLRGRLRACKLPVSYA